MENYLFTRLSASAPSDVTIDGDKNGGGYYCSECDSNVVNANHKTGRFFSVCGTVIKNHTDDDYVYVHFAICAECLTRIFSATPVSACVDRYLENVNWIGNCQED